jgi:hypothetical protein
MTPKYNNIFEINPENDSWRKVGWIVFDSSEM